MIITPKKDQPLLFAGIYGIKIPKFPDSGYGRDLYFKDKTAIIGALETAAQAQQVLLACNPNIFSDHIVPNKDTVMYVFTENDATTHNAFAAEVKTFNDRLIQQQNDWLEQHSLMASVIDWGKRVGSESEEKPPSRLKCFMVKAVGIPLFYGSILLDFARMVPMVFRGNRANKRLLKKWKPFLAKLPKPANLVSKDALLKALQEGRFDVKNGTLT